MKNTFLSKLLKPITLVAATILLQVAFDGPPVSPGEIDEKNIHIILS